MAETSQKCNYNQRACSHYKSVFPIWSYAPTLQGSTLYNFVNAINCAVYPYQITDYISNYATLKESDNFPQTLERFQYTTVYFDLDKMMAKFIDSGETFGNKYILLFAILFLQIEFGFNGKVKTKHANFRIKYYLFQTYFNNKFLVR